MFWIAFAIFLAACAAAGMTGGLFPPGQWYRGLTKPSWTPPNWLFPVAWSVLYLCMAGAGARIAMAEGNGIAMAFWSLQIALNALWTPVFFGLRRIKLGLYVLVALWLSVAGSIAAFAQVDSFAALLFVPYILWVTIAGALNASVWRLNPAEANRKIVFER